MSAVFESETLGATERLIMLALADHADDEGRCYPSIPRLCQRTGLGERAVQTNIRKLQAQGYVEIIPGAGRNGSNLYFVRPTPAPDAPPQEMHPAPDAPPQEMHPAPDAPPPRTKCTSTPAPDAPKPSGTIIEPSVPPVGPPPKKPGKARSRGTRLPDDWVLPRGWREWAISEGWAENTIRLEAEKFQDYWRSAPGQKGVKLDWQATWRNWMRNSKTPKLTPISGGHHEPSRHPDRLQRVVTAAAAGTSGQDWG
ncbi:helix-turn-helix domain-containing protein [Leisingera methylohalidivorans]|uniref:helix-turn-helix domain-containing protein n=1 Tax=Leisingera methylohalidivorans TaxID=133924 RepID=UPI003CCBCB57